MSQGKEAPSSGNSSGVLGLLLLPFKIILWPFWGGAKLFYKHFLSYITGHILRDSDRIYSIKFVWYGDSVYLHPMVWGSGLLYLIAKSDWGADNQGWLLLVWFIGLLVCYLTIMYNFDVIRSGTLALALAALLGLAYFSTQEFAWNPLHHFASHIKSLEASVTPGFYIVASYIFLALIQIEILWAWLFHRVEIDESYVYEHRFLKGAVREPIFAQSLQRETKDLLEVLLLGAADIKYRTKVGYKTFKNVPFASLWLGSALDSLVDYRRRGQVMLERKQRDNETDARVSDAMPDTMEEYEMNDEPMDDADDVGHDDGMSE